MINMKYANVYNYGGYTKSMFHSYVCLLEGNNPMVGMGKATRTSCAFLSSSIRFQAAKSVLEMQAETEAVREHATAFAQRGQIIDKYRERSMYIYIYIYIYICISI